MIGGKRILVVEDEPLVAMSLEDMLTDLGAHVVGPAFDAREALAMLDIESVDAAVLDVNLGNHRSDVVADRLKASGTPFVLATGYGRGAETGIALEKPYRIEQLKEALASLFEA